MTTVSEAMERVKIFILAEELKIDVFDSFQVEGAVWCKHFVNLCVHFDAAYLAIYTTLRFAIKGLPTLTWFGLSHYMEEKNQMY